MSLKSKEKSVADTGADEHLVALPPNRSARRLPQTGPAWREPGTHAGPGTIGRLLLCLLILPIFQRATNTPARWAPPYWTMTEAGAGFKFCCRIDSKTCPIHDGFFIRPLARLLGESQLNRSLSP